MEGTSYLSILTHKLKEVSLAVLPITVLVLLINFAITPLGFSLLARFMIGAILVIIGLAVFLFGIDIGITPIGIQMGSSLIKTKKLWVITLVSFVAALFICVAEPDLHILAGQVNEVTSGLISKTSLVIVVSAGIAVLFTCGLFRIIRNIPLYLMLTALYGIVFVLSLFTPHEFIGIAFDASGATTGALTVPFILAMAIGVSTLKKDSKMSEKDSFGLVAITSVGAIISVLVMGMIQGKPPMHALVTNVASDSESILQPFFHKLPIVALESLLPLLVIYIASNFLMFKLPKRAFVKILVGLLYTYIGLVIFMTGVNAGFMDIGKLIGYKVASLENKAVFIFTGFLLGSLTILAEPAVHILTKSVEKVTSGYIKRKAVLISLSIGIGIAVSLSAIRILTPGMQLWHVLLPGYLISIGLAYISPKIFVGIAFDSGGVASGPMTATFILAFTQGAAEAVETASVLTDGFGMIAMVALLPLIALQILGIIYKTKSKKGGLKDATK
jgi:hypothetical protein